MDAYQDVDFGGAMQEWLPLALDAHLAAQRYVGELYQGGFGVTEDASKAVNWSRKVADAGLPMAQRRLGMMYAQGAGVEVSGSEAFEWLSRAADNGDRQAQYQLGFPFQRGFGTAIDPVSADEWWAIAALWGHPDAADERDCLAQQLDQCQLARGKLLAETWEARGPKPNAYRSRFQDC